MKMICVNLDGVLAEYNGWKGLGHIGDPIQGAQEFVRKLQGLGAGPGAGINVVIFTTRTNTDLNFNDPFFDKTPTASRYSKSWQRKEVVKHINHWLKRNEFPDDVEVWEGTGKPKAAAYVDDRAVSCIPQTTKLPIKMEFECAVNDCEGLIKL